MRLPVLALLLLAGCSQELTPEEQKMKDDRDVAMVERANEAEPPLKQITPDPILYPDIERYDLANAACNYAPGTSLGTRVVAREADAFVKVDGEVLRFAADPGSRELRGGTRSLYNGKIYTLQLNIDGDGTPGTAGKTDYEGKIVMRDAYGRTVFEGAGLAQCISEGSAETAEAPADRP